MPLSALAIKFCSGLPDRILLVDGGADNTVGGPLASILVMGTTDPPGGSATLGGGQGVCHEDVTPNSLRNHLLPPWGGRGRRSIIFWEELLERGGDGV